MSEDVLIKADIEEKLKRINKVIETAKKVAVKA